MKSRRNHRTPADEGIEAARADARKPRTRAEMTDAEFAAIDRKRAASAAIGWIEDMIAHHESGLHDLRSRRAEFIEAAEKGTGFVSFADLVGFAVNDVQNITRNYRLDMAPKHAAALAVAEADVRRTAK